MDFIDQYLDGLCRTCLIEVEASSYGNNTTRQWQSILDRIDECDTLRIAELLSTAVPEIQIQPSDELPKKICRECLQQLLGAYRFQQMCVQSDEQMRDLVSTKHTELKLSIIEALKEHDTDSKTLETAHASSTHQNLEHSAIKIPQHEITEQMQEDETVQYSLENNKVLEACNDEEGCFKELIKNERIEEGNAMHSTISIECKEGETNLSRDEIIEPKEEQLSAADPLEGIDQLPEHCKNSQAELSAFVKNEPIDDEPSIEYSDGDIIHSIISVAKEEVLAIELEEQQVNMKLSQLKCNLCNKSFRKLEYLERHQEFHKSKGDKFQKYVSRRRPCHKNKSPQSPSLDRIRRGEKKPYECPYCPMRFRSSTCMTSHKEIHEGVKQATCDICGKKVRKRNLNKHKLIHSEEKLHKCDLCEKRFFGIHRLRRHSRTHTDEKRYKCKYCEWSYSSFTGLNMHLRIHLGENIFRCELCPLAFPLSSERRLHFATHKNEDPETRERNIKALEEDERWLTEESDLKMKMLFRVWVNTNSRCFLKNKLGTYEAENRVNLKMKANDKIKGKNLIRRGENNILKCHLCEKRFLHMQQLLTHIRTHTGEKPYKCKYCERGFISTSALNGHLRTHLGKNIHRCKFCPLAFPSSEQRLLHLPSHKNDDPETRERNLKALQEEEAKLVLKFSKERCKEQSKDKQQQQKMSEEEIEQPSTDVLATHRKTHVEVNAYCPLRFNSNANKLSHEKMHEEVKVATVLSHKNVDPETPERNIKALREDETESKQRISKENIQQASTEELEQQLKDRIGHNDRKHYECPYCPLRFRTKNILSQHKKIHEGVKREPCDICGKKIRKNYLKEHKQLVHRKEKLHKCDFCEKRFAYINALRQHTNQHTGENPFKCNYCESAYSRRPALNRHLRVHLGDNIYRCEFCPLTFPLVQQRSMHLVTHKNEDPKTRERNFKALREDEAKIRLHFFEEKTRKLLTKKSVHISTKKTQQPSTEESEQ